MAVAEAEGNAQFGEDIRQAALMRELIYSLNGELELNLFAMLNDILWRTRIHMKEDEKRAFIENNLKKKIYLDFNEDGNMILNYKR